MKYAAILRVLAAAGATSITLCHFHGADLMCVNTDGVEGSVSPAPTETDISSYTSCHAHGLETYCMHGSAEVLFVTGEDSDHATDSHDHSHAASETHHSHAAETGHSHDHDHSTEHEHDHSAEHDHSHSHDHSTEHDHHHSESHHSHSGSQSVQTAMVTECHAHGTAYMCVDGYGREGQIMPSPTEAPESFTGCHAHSSETYCMDGDDEVSFSVVEEEEEEEQDCHFHAGVEHCVSRSTENTCERVDRDYNIPLRIGLLFAILATSLFGVLAPIFVKKLAHVSMDGAIFTLLKQFGTGVVISTAFVHLLTHAFLMFSNSCLTLKYEATCAAIAMAGLVLAFLVDFLSRRLVNSRPKIEEKEVSSESSAEEDFRQDKVSVLLLESGIIFHSVLVGITLVVAGDSSFITLFIVILFHQMFEGIALGSRLAEIDAFSTIVKSALGLTYAITTPVGMAIGIGVLHHFNGNDPSTIIALGTLDSLSAGVLVWVGLVEMLAHDWLSGPLLHAGLLKTLCGAFGLVAGLALMSLLGKWA